MTDALHESYATHLEHISELMLKELHYWPWENVPRLRAMASQYLLRTGKRLRPLLVLLFADACGAQLTRTYAAAAAIEVYHTATLIYDDIQDNAEFRRGLPCPHVTSSTSMAMNLAGTIRSLMYHILHRACDLTLAEQVEIHHRIDEAATRVSLGQSIDIGWHEQWYACYQEYPYEQMIRWKSAALFECAAAIGALLAGADPRTVALAASIGSDLGVLFQRVDDYLDIFGQPALVGRPLYNDLHEGKVSLPVLCLLDQLRAHGRTDTVTLVLQHLAARAHEQRDWHWLLDLMRTYNVAGLLQEQVRQAETQLAALLQQFPGRQEVVGLLALFLASLVAGVQQTPRI
jgi:geranylgeranyl diphosphate synthase type I